MTRIVQNGCIEMGLIVNISLGIPIRYEILRQRKQTPVQQQLTRVTRRGIIGCNMMQLTEKKTTSPHSGPDDFRVFVQE